MAKSDEYNILGQRIGFSLKNWKEAGVLPRVPIIGKSCRLEPIQLMLHGPQLYENFSLEQEGSSWTFLSYGPFRNYQDFVNWLETSCLGDDPLFFAVIDLSNNVALGVLSLMNIKTTIGVIELGHVHFSKRLRGTTLSTEVIYLIIRKVFEDLGYRRLEWKCDTLNTQSKRAALRYGFTFEGIFRQATIYKNRNRDTAWYSLLDVEWPKIKRAYELWLAPNNFESNGTQVKSLSEFILNTE